MVVNTGVAQLVAQNNIVSAPEVQPASLVRRGGSRFASKISPQPGHRTFSKSTRRTSAGVMIRPHFGQRMSRLAITLARLIFFRFNRVHCTHFMLASPNLLVALLRVASAKCAYLLVVFGSMCPSNFPILSNGSPWLTNQEA